MSRKRTPHPDLDRRYMAWALRLAERALGRTRPNPVVGCVVVDRAGKVAGAGYHQRAGQPHAEVEALRRAGSAAHDATVYVTLEPCSHFGRTPPCADALIAAGVARVVVAMEDPNPLVAGRGLQRLREAGIAVTTGVLAAEAAELNLPFTTWITRKRPLVTLKSATSLDGMTATATGHSQWITGELARARVQRLRDRNDAVLIGIGTLLADNPRLNCRLAGGRDPLRIVVDSRLRTPREAAILTSSTTAPLWIATTLPPDRWGEWAATPGVELLHCAATPEGRVELHDLLSQLGARGITSVLAECGGTLSAALLAARLVDRVVLFLAPLLIGGEGRPLLAGWGVERLERAPRLHGMQVATVGEDLMVTAEVSWTIEGN